MRFRRDKFRKTIKNVTLGIEIDIIKSRFLFVILILLTVIIENKYQIIVKTRKNDYVCFTTEVSCFYIYYLFIITWINIVYCYWKNITISTQAFQYTLRIQTKYTYNNKSQMLFFLRFEKWNLSRVSIKCIGQFHTKWEKIIYETLIWSIYYSFI